jgi:hypothetical protein
MSLSNRWKTGSDFAIGLISSPRSEQDTARKRCPSNDRVAGNKTEKKTVLSTPWEQDSGALHSKRSKALPNQRSVPRRQLHGVVTPQRVQIRQQRGTLQQRRGHLYDPVILSEILAEQRQGACRLGNAQSRLATTAREGGSDFHFGNASQIDEIPRRGRSQVPRPDGYRLLDIPLDDCTAVEEVICHLSGARG